MEMVLLDFVMETGYGGCPLTLSPIPDYLKEFTSVFSKQSFDALLESREWDHAMELIPGSKPSGCKIYPLSPAEQKELDIF